jgi:hypothetical protein
MGRVWAMAVFLWGMVSAQAANVHALTALDLATAQSRNVSLSNGKVHVVAFLSAKCPCSESHESLLTALVHEFPEFEFVGINSNAGESQEVAEKHFTQASLPFPVLKDPMSVTAKEFRALKTPHVYVVDGDGEIIYSGGVTSSATAKPGSKPFLRTALLQVRAGKRPDPAETRTLGCMIERP